MYDPMKRPEAPVPCRVSYPEKGMQIEIKSTRNNAYTFQFEGFLWFEFEWFATVLQFYS